MSEQPLCVKGIDHVVLNVTDMKRSLEFYVDLLGFEDPAASQAAERQRSFLRCGSQGLDLIEVLDNAHGSEEMNHLAVGVQAVDIDTAVEKLVAKGVEISHMSSRGTYVIFDPDHHSIELLPL